MDHTNDKKTDPGLMKDPNSRYRLSGIPLRVLRTETTGTGHIREGKLTSTLHNCTQMGILHRFHFPETSTSIPGFRQLKLNCFSLHQTLLGLNQSTFWNFLLGTGRDSNFSKRNDFIVGKTPSEVPFLDSYRGFWSPSEVDCRSFWGPRVGMVVLFYLNRLLNSLHPSSKRGSSRRSTFETDFKVRSTSELTSEYSETRLLSPSGVDLRTGCLRFNYLHT